MTTPLVHVLADTRYAWKGPSLLITTARGECAPHEFLTGFYFREARHLSALRLEVNGSTPWLCADSTRVDDVRAGASVRVDRPVTTPRGPSCVVRFVLSYPSS